MFSPTKKILVVCDKTEGTTFKIQQNGNIQIITSDASMIQQFLPEVNKIRLNSGESISYDYLFYSNTISKQDSILNDIDRSTWQHNKFHNVFSLPKDTIGTGINEILEQKIKGPQIPQYLQSVYWWAYLHPNAVQIFENQFIVEAILWGNYSKLRDYTLNELGSSINGRVLQIACAYGNFTSKLIDRLGKDAHLDVIDVAAVQLVNLEKKIGQHDKVSLHLMDASALEFKDESYDHVVLYFLLHEVPKETRVKILQEAMRVAKKGSKIVIMDYHKPVIFNPLRYFMKYVLKTLEPFALDLWKDEITSFIPNEYKPSSAKKETFFGGLYQKITLIK